MHGDKYDYSSVVYKTNKVNVDIICKLHGVFSQNPNHHINGHGCPTCGITSSLKEIEIIKFLRTLGYSPIQSYKPKWLGGRKELDIFIPDLSLAIEYNGFMYHHSSVLEHGFASKTNIPSDLHLEKYIKCKEQGVTLIHIFEFENFKEWLNLLERYIKSSEIYSVSFTNNLRTIDYRGMSLKYYGQSFIVPLHK